MSEVSCSACRDLQNAAPEFVTHGVTDNVCSALASNKGLDTSNGHNDATDLHLANDCLVGRMKDETKHYDVCDWKEFMEWFIGNVYEMFKAIICALGGIWTSISSIWNKLNNHESRISDLEDGSGDFCDVTDNIMELALHRLHGVRQTKRKADVTSANLGIICNTVTAQYCDKTAIIDMVALSIDVGTCTSLQNGDILCTIEKADVVPELMHESTWNGIMTYGFMQSLCTVEGKWVIYAVAVENSTYPGKLSVQVHSTVGPTQVASGHIATIQNTPRFFIIQG